MGHSLGPWKWGATAEHAPGIPPSAWYVEDATGVAIAYDIPCEADARLMAAASELLEALEVVLPWESHPADCDCSRCKARALIRRVKEGG